MTLFREEAVEHVRSRLYGEVNLAVPLPWQAIGYTLVLSLLVTVAYFGLSSYSHVERVDGVLAPEHGIIRVTAPRPGVIESLAVQDGDAVRGAASLVTFRPIEKMEQGGTVESQMLRLLDNQIAELANQQGAHNAAGVTERAQITQQISTARQELAFLDEGVAIQRDVVRAASEDVERVREISERGFISQGDFTVRENALRRARQELFQLEASRAAKSSEIANRTLEVAGTGARERSDAAQLSLSRIGLLREAAATRATQGFAITAPIAGHVTAVTARNGQIVANGEPLLSIVPEGRLQGQLYIPSRAIAFVEVGQPVRLALDAFPYQTFGTLAARITRLSTVPVASATSAAEPVYLATVELRDTSIMAFGRRKSLRAGMILKASIVTRRQSLLEWLFEPLFAVARR